MGEKTVYDMFEELAQLIADAAPTEIIKLKASPELDAHVENLMFKLKSDIISPKEKDELDQMMFLQRFISLAKIKTVNSRDEVRSIVKKDKVDKSLVDYSKRSWTTVYVIDDCRYPISFNEEFTSELGDLVPTSDYIIVATGLYGTHTATFSKTTDGFGWDTETRTLKS